MSNFIIIINYYYCHYYYYHQHLKIANKPQAPVSSSLARLLGSPVWSKGCQRASPPL